jgi:hypothetical protein
MESFAGENVTNGNGKKVWKVTRIWYVEAINSIDAILKTKGKMHREIYSEKVKRMPK